MSADDRGQLLLYFAAHVPGGLQTQDVDLLLRLPIFPGIAHTSQSLMWRALIGTPCMRIVCLSCMLVLPSSHLASDHLPPMVPRVMRFDHGNMLSKCDLA